MDIEKSLYTYNDDYVHILYITWVLVNVMKSDTCG